jgi:hypothetical protein
LKELVSKAIYHINLYHAGTHSQRLLYVPWTPNLWVRVSTILFGRTILLFIARSGYSLLKNSKSTETELVHIETQ